MNNYWNEISREEFQEFQIEKFTERELSTIRSEVEKIELTHHLDPTFGLIHIKDDFITRVVIKKTSDEWYLVNLIKYDGHSFFKCDQIDGLIEFIKYSDILVGKKYESYGKLFESLEEEYQEINVSQYEDLVFGGGTGCEDNNHIEEMWENFTEEEIEKIESYFPDSFESSLTQETENKIHFQVDDEYSGISVSFYKLVDEWFVVDETHFSTASAGIPQVMIHTEKAFYYKCDQMNGLEKLLSDKKQIYDTEPKQLNEGFFDKKINQEKQIKIIENYYDCFLELMDIGCEVMVDAPNMKRERNMREEDDIFREIRSSNTDIKQQGNKWSTSIVRFEANTLGIDQKSQTEIYNLLSKELPRMVKRFRGYTGCNVTAYVYVYGKANRYDKNSIFRSTMDLESDVDRIFHMYSDSPPVDGVNTFSVKFETKLPNLSKLDEIASIRVGHFVSLPMFGDKL